MFGGVVGEPDEAVIRETKALESADKNTVIDRVERLGLVDEAGCTGLLSMTVMISLRSVAEDQQ